MNTNDLLAAPSVTPFCGTCIHWNGSREWRDGYCITTQTAHGYCTHDDAATSKPTLLKQAREQGCEIWRAPESAG